MDINLSKLWEIVEDSLACFNPWGLKGYNLVTEWWQQEVKVCRLANLDALASAMDDVNL